jgi:hypothetical protein
MRLLAGTGNVDTLMAAGDDSNEGDLRCAGCGDVIGVYEPIVHLGNGSTSETSRAAEPSLSASSPSLVYHAHCYAQASGSPGT